MDIVLGYAQEFWGLLLVAVVFIIVIGAVFVTQGRAKAGQIILSLMLRLEKQAEDYALETGDEKFSFVVEKGYQLLPKYVRMIISYKMFEELADKLYSEAKNYLLNLNAKPIPAPYKERKETDPG